MRAALLAPQLNQPLRRQGYTPTDVAVAWWNADDTSDGGVAAWIDRVAALTPVQATGDNQPVSAATSFNGRRGVTFDGSNDYLEVALTTGLPTGSNDSEVWALVSQTAAPSGTSQSPFSYGGASSSATRFVLRNGGAINRVRVGATGVNLTDGERDFSGLHIVAGRWLSSVESVIIDGYLWPNSSSVATLATSTTRTRIGAAASGAASGFWTGIIRHIIVTGALTALQRQKMEGWLAWDGGIPHVLPWNHPYKNGPP